MIQKCIDGIRERVRIKSHNLEQIQNKYKERQCGRRKRREVEERGGREKEERMRERKRKTFEEFEMNNFCQEG